MSFKVGSRKGKRIKKSLIEVFKLASKKNSFGKSSKRVRR